MWKMAPNAHTIDVHMIRRYAIFQIEVDEKGGVLSFFLAGPDVHVNINNMLLPMPTVRVTIIEDWVGVRPIGRGCARFQVADTAKEEITKKLSFIANSLEREEVFTRYSL